MVYRANQEQNETYTFKDMMCQEYCQKFIDVMMVEVNDHKDRDYWTLTEKGSTNRSLCEWTTVNHFGNLVVQTQEIS